MLKKVINYKDYNDQDRTEDCYFNLTESEVLELELGVEGGLAEYLNMIVKEKKNHLMIPMIKSLILQAFGKKSADGRQFIKNDEIRSEFLNSPMYNILFMEIALNEATMAEFIIGILPKKMSEELQTQLSEEQPIIY